MALTNEERDYLVRAAQAAFTDKTDYQIALSIIHDNHDLSTTVNHLNSILPSGHDIISLSSSYGIPTPEHILLMRDNDFSRLYLFNKDMKQQVLNLENEIDALKIFKQRIEIQINNILENNIRLTSQIISYKIELDDSKKQLHKVSATLDNVCHSGEVNCETIGKIAQFEPDIDGLNDVII